MEKTIKGFKMVYQKPKITNYAEKLVEEIKKEQKKIFKK